MLSYDFNNRDCFIFKSLERKRIKQLMQSKDHYMKKLTLVSLVVYILNVLLDRLENFRQQFFIGLNPT